MTSNKFFLQVFIFILSIMSVSTLQSGFGSSNPVENEAQDVEYEQDYLLVIQHLRATTNCKTLADLSDPSVFRNLKLSFNSNDDEESSTAILRLLEQPREQLFRDNVREVSISSSYSRFNWTLLDNVFSVGFKNLETLRWEADKAISSALLRSLEANSPSAKLYYTLSFQHLEDVSGDGSFAIGVIGEEFEHAKRNAARHSILNSSNLYSLKGGIYYGGEPNRDDMRLLWQALTSCPNIRELEISLEWGGCICSGGQPYSFDFHSSPGIKFPPLEIIKLRGYDFLTKDNREWSDDWRDLEYNQHIAVSWRGFVERTLDSLFARHPFHWSRPVPASPADAPWRPAESNKTNLQEWMEAMDWFKLHTLHLGQTSVKVLELLKGHVLPSLRHFTFEHGWLIPATELVDFLSHTSLPLESINLNYVSLNSSDGLLNIIKEKHGVALKNLRLTRAEGRKRGQFLSLDSIGQIRDSCPNIESLAIDIEYLDSWDYQFLHSLISLPQLRHLSLYRTIHSPNQERTSMDALELEGYAIQRNMPSLHYKSAPGLFRYLRKHKSGCELEKLDIYSEFYDANYSDWVYSHRSQGHPSTIKCFVDEYGLEVCDMW